MIASVSGIYRIRNLLTGRAYVGSAVNMARRANIHLHQLRHDKHHSKKLQRAWNKAGESQFSFEVIEIVFDRALLIEREQFWLDQTRAATHGYNCVPKAGSSLGRKHSPETIAKLCEKRRQRKTSDETRALMSSMRKGKPKSVEHRQRIGAAQVGKVIPPEVREKMSESAKSRVLRSPRKADGTFGSERDVRWSEPKQRIAA